MNTTEPYAEGPAEADLLNEALAAFQQALEEGSTSDPESFLLTNPHFGDQGVADALFQFADNLRRLGSPLFRSVPKTPSLEPEDVQKLFPQYTVLEAVGQGGFGSVYKVRQYAGNVAALKLLHSPGLSTERFIQSTWAMGQLRHEHVVHLYDSGKTHGYHYLLMEFVAGSSLRQYVDTRSSGEHTKASNPRDRCLPPLQAARLVLQVCAALEYAHERGVVHRDIKPENILVTQDLHVKLIDFDLARLLGPKPGALDALTRTGQVLGTLAYMPPEQKDPETAKFVDHRADIYALGVVFYELLTGRVPEGNFANPSALAPMDKGFDDIVRRMLAPEPGDRYQQVSAVRKELEGLVNPPPSGPPPPPEPGPTGWRWTRILAGLIAIALALALVAWRWQPETGGALPDSKFSWLADPTGGAPYVWEVRSNVYTGFELELAACLAKSLGVRAEMVRGSWDLLPQNLNRGLGVAIINGYEWTPDREIAMRSSIPYYVYRLQLVAGPDRSELRDWADLERPNPHRGDGKWHVGALAESAAHRYIARPEFAKTVTVLALSEEGSTGVMHKVATGELDATVQDTPMVNWYLKRDPTFRQLFKDLRVVGKAIKPNEYPYYVVFVRKQDTQLQEQISRALANALKDNTLRSIYERYGIYDEEDYKKLLEVAEVWERNPLSWPPDAPAHSMGLGEYAVLLGQASLVTVLLACLSMPAALLTGLLVAVGRLYGPRPLGVLLAAYVEIVRGTPLLMQLFVVFFALPQAGIHLPPFWAGVLALAINYSAYEAEIYRAGLQAIPHGQMEAALALGMSKWTALRRVIVPQALRVVVPPVTNDFIALFKDTSIVGVINVVELSYRLRSLMVNRPQDVFPLCVMAASLYLLMSYPLSLAARRLEKKVPRVAG